MISLKNVLFTRDIWLLFYSLNIFCCFIVARQIAECNKPYKNKCLERATLAEEKMLYILMCECCRDFCLLQINIIIIIIIKRGGLCIKQSHGLKLFYLLIILREKCPYIRPEVVNKSFINGLLPKCLVSGREVHEIHVYDD